MSKINTSHASAARTEIFFLINDQPHGWRRLPLDRGLSIYQGDQRLPEHVGQRLRVAFAHMEMSAAHPATLKRLEFAEWDVNDDGRVDQGATMRAMLERLDPLAGGKPQSALTDAPIRIEDLAAIKRCLGIPDEDPSPPLTPS